MKEEWKEIPGYEGRYAISSLGRVMSLQFKGRRRRKVLALENCGQYRRVALVNSNQEINKHLVHRLVASVFLGDIEGKWVCHIDDDRSNDQVDNIYIGSPATNTRDKIRLGTQRRGQRHGMAKLSRDDVLAIRAKTSGGEMQKHLATEYGVSKGHISNIVRRVTWRHVVPEAAPGNPAV